jgi:pre-rRNA-processing protein TSR1
MPGGHHHHRSGGLRQTNKKNKRASASKRSVGRNQGGRVNVAKGSGSSAAMAAQSKADRRNHQVQLRDKKRSELLRKRRAMDAGTTAPPPRVVGIIALGSSPHVEERVKKYILSTADRVLQTTEAVAQCQFDVHKKNGQLTILTAHSLLLTDQGIDGNDEEDDAAVLAALDMARVCDILLFVVDGNASPIAGRITEIQLDQSSVHTKTTHATGQDWDFLISSRGDRILAAVKGQGLPTPLTILAHTEKSADDVDHMTFQSTKSLRRSAIKRHLDLKKYVSRFAVTEFGSEHDKVVEITLEPDVLESMEEDEPRSATETDGATLVRTLCTMACSPPKWVANSPRSYLLTNQYEYDPSTKALRLTGYIRGPVPLDVNALFHVPRVGTFACRRIERALPPFSRPHQAIDIQSSHDAVEADPTRRESLHRFATPDALDGEQNLIGFDEAEEEDNAEKEEDAFARPAGWSDYQSAWLDAVDQDAIEANDNGELADALNKKSSAASIATDGLDMDMEEANEVSEAERQALLQHRKKQHSEETDFPDEVQVQEDEKARERFARYRSLKSFRKSYWDPKENLPDSYASIFHFSSFKQTQRTVMNDMKDLVREAEIARGNFFGKSLAPMGAGEVMEDDESEEDKEDFLEGCVPSGSYVTLTLEAVSPESMADIAPNAMLTAVSLLPHENKVSVLHMGLSQTLGCDTTDEKFPIKSKDVLTFRCGWRTWKARPVFSQNNLNCDKHKFERFLPTGGAFFAASVFGPVTYTPCPILVFRERDETIGAHHRELVAIGSMIGADADRIVVKRIVLTGYPVRVHKRHATVKYMFYEPDDVKWFMPAGLHTKHGLQGNIVQSVGEHGTMKCLFNAPIKQHDTVCLPLYKRIFPKYAKAVGASDERSRSGATTFREGLDNLIVL